MAYNRKIFAALVSVLIVGGALVILSRIINPAPSCCFSDFEKGLSYFRTITVSVDFEGNESLEKQIGNTGNSLAVIILKQLANQVERQFGNTVSLDLSGKSITFDTNPLNLALRFSFKTSQADPSKIELRTTVRRSYFFTALTDSFKNAALEKRFLELRASKPKRLREPAFHAALESLSIPFPLIINGRAEIDSKVDFVISTIVQNMNPNSEVAAEAEEGLGKIR